MRKFIQVDDNTWVVRGEDWTYRYNHFSDLVVTTKQSKFSSARKFCVELAGTSDKGDCYNTVVKSFDEREQAQEFAAKLAALLNEQEDNQHD